MSSVNVEITGDARKLEQAFNKIEAGQDRVEKGFGDVATTAKDSARQIEAANEAAADKGKAAYSRIVTELKKQGPEGRAQAKALEQHLQDAGKGGRRSMAEIVDELKTIDPAAAQSAATIRKEMDDASKKGESSFKRFGKSAVTQLASVAAGYVGIQQAIGAVTAHLQTQEQLLTRSLDKTLSLAKAQQEAAKNLAAYSAVERDELLQQAVPEIARQTGFADVGALTIALGTAASKGATADEARAAVSAAARVERLTPENVSATAAGAVSVQRQSGIQDPRAAIALLQTTGTQSAITEAAKLVENLPKALGIVSTVRGQNAEEASRQAAAIFAQVTQGGNDSQGNSSATFTLDFGNRLNKMFSEIEKQRVDARSELVRLEKKDDPLEKEVVRMEELRQLIPALESTVDPGTLFGRIEALQKSPEMAKAFIGEGFGEKQFQVVLKDMLDATSAGAKGLRASADVIQASPQFFEQQAADQASMTPQLRIANAVASASAGVTSQESFDQSAATLKAVRDITEKALTSADTGGFLGGVRNRLEVNGIMGFGGIQSGGLAGSNALTEGVSAITALSKRRDALAVGGMDASKELKAQQLDTAIESITTLLEGQISGGTFDDRTLQRGARSTRSAAQGIEDRLVAATVEGAAENQQRSRELLERLATAMDQQNALMAQQNQLMGQTADNTKPPKPNPSDVIRGANAQSDARAPR